jgi:hypothetical protein
VRNLGSGMEAHSRSEMSSYVIARAFYTKER